MNSLEIFKFDEKRLHTVIENDQPMFVARDICKILGIKSVKHALRRLDEDEGGVLVIPTLGGKQKINAVNESGLYGLIFQSRKSNARKFRKWVTSEILPKVRNHGGYINPSATSEQVSNLQSQLHNLSIEAKHYKMLYENESQAVEIWKAKSVYGSVSPKNHLPRLLQRRGAWVADRRFKNSIVPNIHQMTFFFINGKEKGSLR